MMSPMRHHRMESEDADDQDDNYRIDLEYVDPQEEEESKDNGPEEYNAVNATPVMLPTMKNAHVVPAIPFLHPSVVRDRDDDDSRSDLGSSFRQFRAPPKRALFLITTFTMLTGIFAAVGLVSHYMSPQNESNNSSENGYNTASDTNSDDISNYDTEVIDTVSLSKAPLPFITYSWDLGVESFVLNKSLYQSAFIVAPTIVKHSAPPQAGLEAGADLLETYEYAFHFELIDNGYTMALVRDIYTSRLDSEDDDLKEAFDNNMWPGRSLYLSVLQEDENSYYIDAQPLLSNGFMVSTLLFSSSYTVDEQNSAYYNRNTYLELAYELETGSAIVAYGIALLPEEVMPQRIADDRIGYFSTRYARYAAYPHDKNRTVGENALSTMDKKMTYIQRARIGVDEQSGEVTEPIRYYIDPSVPERWRRSFADGVEAWNVAFKEIGLDNAVKAILPGDDDWPTDYKLGDIRYNSISVMLSDTVYAIGTSVSDPRSGEILHSMIRFEYGFFNDVVSDFALRSPVVDSVADLQDSPLTKRTWKEAQNKQTKFDAQGAHLQIDPHGKHRKCGLGSAKQSQEDRLLLGMEWERAMMQEGDKNSTILPDWVVARYFMHIVMHEVGHTLGLRHNFGGSSGISREQLGNTEYLQDHGLSSTVMDYIPVNIFSDLTAEQILSNEHIFYMTKVGAYDKAAIAYGYSRIEDENPGYKHPELTRIASTAPLFLTDEDVVLQTNPLAQEFDLSNDTVNFADDRLNFAPIWRANAMKTLAVDASWTQLWRRERGILKLVRGALDNVEPMFGGVYNTHAHKKQGDDRYEAELVSKEDQLRALKVIKRVIRADEGIFPDPETYASYLQIMSFDPVWDCDEPNMMYECLGRENVDIDKLILNIREQAILSALSPGLERVVRLGSLSPITPSELLSEVEEAVFMGDTLQDRVLQDFYTNLLESAMTDPNEDPRIQRAIFDKYGMDTVAPGAVFNNSVANVTSASGSPMLK